MEAALRHSNVTALLQQTLGAVSSEDRKLHDRLHALEVQAEALKKQLQRKREQQNASTQTTESASPAFKALQDRVALIEHMLHGGGSHHNWDTAAVEVESGKEEVGLLDANSHEAGEPIVSSPQATPREPQVAIHKSSQKQSTGADREPNEVGAAPIPSAAPFQVRRSDSGSTSPPQTPGAPSPSPAGSRSGRPPLRVELPSAPSRPDQLNEASSTLARVLKSPKAISKTQPQPSTVPDERGSIVLRLQRCETNNEQATAWLSTSLRTELDGLRAAVMKLAENLDALSARKMDHASMQIWCSEFAAQMASTVSALQDETNYTRQLMESRLGQAQATMAMVVEQQQQPPSSLTAQQLLVHRAADERFARMWETIRKLHDKLDHKAERSDLGMLEEALYGELKPRSATISAVPLHDRFALITPLLGAVADARSSAAQISRRLPPPLEAPPAPPPSVPKVSVSVTPQKPYRAAPNRTRPTSAVGKLSASMSYLPKAPADGLAVAGCSSPALGSQGSPVPSAKHGGGASPAAPKLHWGRSSSPPLRDAPARGRQKTRPSSASAANLYQPNLAVTSRQTFGSDGNLYRSRLVQTRPDTSQSG